MEWLQQWIANRQKRQELNNIKAANPVAAANAATIWQNASNSTGVPDSEGSGTELIQQEDGTVIRVPKTTTTTTTPKVDTTVTEGPGTTLIQQEDGTVIRVPTGEETPGSTTIQTDLNEKENDINYDIIPKDKSVSEKVDDLLSMEEAKAQWLHKTRNSPAQKSGAWDSDEGREQLWQTHLKNQQWKKDKGRSYTHGHLLPSAQTTSEKVDDFIENGTKAEIDNEQINNEQINNEQINNEQINNEQTNGEDKSVSEKVDDLVEDLTDEKKKKPTNPLDMMGF
jgi:hypothetical protein